MTQVPDYSNLTPMAEAYASFVAAVLGGTGDAPRERGNCYGHPEAVWPPDTSGAKYRWYSKHMPICAGCPVTDWCASRRDGEPEGIWAGTVPFTRTE